MKRKLLVLAMAFMMCVAYMPFTAMAASGATPVSAVYSGADLHYTPGDDWLDGLYEAGNMITVTYSDNTTKVYKYVEGDEDNFYWLNGVVNSEDDNISVSYLGDSIKKGSKQLELNVGIGVIDDDENDFVELSMTVPVSEYPKPASADFVPAAGFEVQGGVDDEYLDEKELFGEGNKIVITYDDGSTEEYVYGIRTYEDGDKYEGFHYRENYKSLWFEDTSLGEPLKEGANNVTLKLGVYSGSEDYALDLNLLVNASYRPTCDWFNYVYTGKTITPKVRVWYKGEKVPSECYTYSLPQNKKIGFYSFDVNIKPEYQAQYGEKAECSYQIGPKSPASKKVKAGRKSFTVSWKKPSSFPKSQISGYIIEYTTNPNVWEASIVKYVSKKKTSAAIKGLKGGKKYYVKVYSYKNTSNGSRVWSEETKWMKVKTKKK